jgi:glutamate dehydrogenase
MRIEMRTLVERASRWLVTNRRPPLDSSATVDFFRDRVQAVMLELPTLLTGRELDAFETRRELFVRSGQVPDDLAVRTAVLHPAYQLLYVLEIADRDGLDPVEVARVHFQLGERLGLPMLVGKILALPRDDRWQTMARAALRDDVYSVHAQLTAQVLRSTDPGQTAPARIAAWEEGDELVVARAAATLEDICADEAGDLARVSVGLRVVRGLLAG